MDGFSSLGKILMIVGGLLFLLGLFTVYADKIPLIGKLPGDIKIEKRNFTLYFPIVTCIVLSIIISLILNLFSRK